MSNDPAVDTSKFSDLFRGAEERRGITEFRPFFFFFSERNPSRSSAGNPDIRRKKNRRVGPSWALIP